MLNKELCLMCLKRQYSEGIEPIFELARFEEYWEKGKCFCQSSPRILIKVADIPNECPYIVEHFVSKESASMVQ
jgi:hypothetical protein